MESSGESLDEITLFMKKFEKLCLDFDNLATSVGVTLSHQVQSSITVLSSILESSALCTDLVGMVLKEGTGYSSEVARSVAMTSHLMPTLAGVSVNDGSAFSFSNAWKVIVVSEEPVDCQEGEFTKRLVWELPDSSLDRQLMSGQSGRRKLALSESATKRIKDSQAHEPSGHFSRSLNTTNASTGYTRRDTFRQRKPNTSRPPSMHVDDYVARERNIDGASSASNIVNSTPRGTLSGRPPSIHVDEFMARQKERQNLLPAPSGDAPHEKSKETSLDGNIRAKPESPCQPKADLNDDQEIDIVFDEESGSEDKLSFPQPDDGFQSPPVIIGENSPGPIAEETENQENESIPSSQRGTPVRKDNESPCVDISSQAAMLSDVNASSERKYSISSPEKTSFHDHADEQSSPYIATDRPIPISSCYPTQPFQSSSIPSAFTGLQAQTQYMLAGTGGSASNDLANAEAKLLWNTFSVNRLPMDNFSSGLSARQMPPPPPYSAAATQHAPMSSCPAAVLYNPGHQHLPHFSAHPFNKFNSHLAFNKIFLILSLLSPRYNHGLLHPHHHSSHILRHSNNLALSNYHIKIGLRHIHWVVSHLKFHFSFQTNFLFLNYSFALTVNRDFCNLRGKLSLLSDREKLCQLLEQNPKLMQMLQERIGQL
ncbi:hypothetical protein PR202_ga31023 [Eleusine coracana subsp. coracana]|uniref:Uncharacterized protein n=1 Tax=Eleusine coracana subsp. coracana TaxID=191504 RepID=A0AAV5DRI2_ELECO|nr:hypothetical protein PR202_ga31023 [Eleusine coracana subsp. coracana]